MTRRMAYIEITQLKNGKMKLAQTNYIEDWSGIGEGLERDERETGNKLLWTQHLADWLSAGA